MIGDFIHRTSMIAVVGWAQVMREPSSVTGSSADEHAAPSGYGAADLSELRILQRAMRLLLSPAPLDQVLTELMRLMAAAGTARGVAIVFLEPAGRLVPGLDLNLPEGYLAASAGRHVGCGACGQAIEQGALVVVADTRTDPRFAAAREQAQQLGIKAVVAAPIVASDGASLGALAFHFDRPHTLEDLERGRTYAVVAAAILEHKQAEATVLRRAADESAMREKQEYLAMVSHDLRNPLSAILTSATLLQQRLVGGAEAERARKQTDVIIRSVRLMDRLITDLLDLSQIESGQLRLRRQRHGVRELVRDAIEGVQAQAHKKRLTIDVDIAEGVTTLTCDLERIQQVLGNLLGNAVKFTPEGGNIRMGAALTEDMVEFTVSDSGIGIPREQLPRIFDRYWQAKHQDRRGIGLGLSIARGIVEAHGGRIRVESTAGIGTTFYFTVPLRRVDDGVDTAEDVADFFDLPVAAAQALLERSEHERAWEPGPTPATALLRVSPGPRYAGAQACLVRIANGGTFPYHEHRAAEHLFIIHGGLRNEDGSEAWTGERIVYPPGTGQSPAAIGEEACMCAVMIMPCPH